MGQVGEAPVILIDNGDDRHWLVMTVGNVANPVFPIKPARLFGDIAGRIVQPEERLMIFPPVFGNYMTMVVAIKFVEHHSVIAGDSVSFRNNGLPQIRRIEGLLETGERRLNGVIGMSRGLSVLAGYGFQ